MRLSAPPLSKAHLEQLLVGFLPDSTRQEVASDARAKEGGKEMYAEGSPSGSKSQADHAPS